MVDSERVTEDFFKGHDFEDRVLYHIVSLTGEMPVGYEGSITEADIAVQLTKELNISSDFVHSEQFHASRERGTILAAIQELDKSGVAKWQEEWERKNKPDTANAQLAQSRLRDAQEAWVEVARLRRELRLARKTLPSLIADDELRQRCEDLLAAGHHYDRVIREACVILENRVRVTIGGNQQITGTPLMELAFSPRNPKLSFSNVEQEQLGVMQFYRGTIAFFRNTTGHHLIDTYTQDDALRFVAWIDLLLAMLKTVSGNVNATVPNTP